MHTSTHAHFDFGASGSANGGTKSRRLAPILRFLSDSFCSGGLSIKERAHVRVTGLPWASAGVAGGAAPGADLFV